LQETVTLKVENPEGGVLTWEVILFQPSEIETCEDGDLPGRYKTFLLCSAVGGFPKKPSSE